MTKFAPKYPTVSTARIACEEAGACPVDALASIAFHLAAKPDPRQDDGTPMNLNTVRAALRIVITKVEPKRDSKRVRAMINDALAAASLERGSGNNALAASLLD